MSRNPEPMRDRALLEALLDGSLIQTGRARGGVRTREDVEASEAFADTMRTRVGYALAALASRGILNRGLGNQWSGRLRWHRARSTDVGTGVGAVGTVAWPELHHRGLTPRQVLETYIRGVSDTIRRSRR